MMKLHPIPCHGGLPAIIACSLLQVAATVPARAAEPPDGLSQAGLDARLRALRAEIQAALPVPDAARLEAIEQAAAGQRRCEAEAAAARDALGKLQSAKGLVDHARRKWIGGAEEGIAKAAEALRKATSDAEREAARQQLAHWQADKEAGLKALAEREAALRAIAADEPALKGEDQRAQAALARAQAAQQQAAGALLETLGKTLESDRLDPRLVTAAVLAEATPAKLAAFASQSPASRELTHRLLADVALMRDMLVAGGARAGAYGRAMEILAAIRKASPAAARAPLDRLALAVSLEHAVPVPCTTAVDSRASGPARIDPVQRYLHYEKAFLNGDLDPAFAGFEAWEYRMVVNSDVPDGILAWGRTMLRNYRPDHVLNPDYGWRYSGAVRTEVPYGSQHVANDLPSLHPMQNILKNGGVCGRRAFFGRFILRSFGIPTWGVTQHKHAALSHWTPDGWVVNLGAGFHASWWDKGDSPMAGSQFLLETRARRRADDFLQVLRARWIGRALGEEPVNERRQQSGGLWNRLGHWQALRLAEQAAAPLKPLGEALAEANERKPAVIRTAHPAEEGSATPVLAADGSRIIPAAAIRRTAGHALGMKCFEGGTQLHCLGGFRGTCTVDAPHAGPYTLRLRFCTAQEGRHLRVGRGDTIERDGPPAVEIPTPCTLGAWQDSEPVTLTLAKGANPITLALSPESRGISIQQLQLKPMRAGGEGR